VFSNLLKNEANLENFEKKFIPKFKASFKVVIQIEWVIFHAMMSTTEL